MDKAFNVDISAISDISFLPKASEFRDDKLPDFFQEKIPEKMQNDKKVLDGKKLEDSWFKPVKADFFISHKYKDSDKAKRLGAYLQSKGKTVFIDSCIWGSVYRLQKILDDGYCQNDDKKTYAYNKVMKSTSYTHMLLTNALLKTLENCENFIFLNTKNSINAENIIKDTSETNSPWIYFEINVANALLKEKFKMRQFSESKENCDVFPEMAFEADLKNFSKVNIKKLLDFLNIPIQKERNQNEAGVEHNL